MFCKHCGSNLPDGASFCVTCSKKITTDTPYAQDFTFNTTDTDFSFDSSPQPQAPQPKDEERDAHGGRILCFAILALALSASLYLAPIGTVFYILARINLGKYIAKYGETEGRASVGKALSIAALPVNIVMMVCISLILIAILLV